ncbi:MAG TPA: sigma-70 family RNA polymerase sigma factor [Opitutaceae bacterium]|nr:sigma-70 family RNA polymerase sigma factor [Opitutaceae bacterium]
MQPPPSDSSPVREPLPDQMLVNAVIGGEPERFAELISRYNQRLYRVGWSYLRDHALIEDAMQNAYIKAFRALAKFQRNSSFGTWLTRIMINECLMALRQKKSRPEELFEPALLERSSPADTAASSPESANTSEMKTLLEKAVASLPPIYRSVFLLREVEHLSTAQTASCLRISRVSAKVRLHRAKALVKEKLLAESATAELFAYEAPLCNALTARVMVAIRALPPELSPSR